MFLVDIWVSRGRCVSWPSDCSLTKDVIAGRIGLAGRQIRVDCSQLACGHLAMPHLPLLSTRSLHSQETGGHLVCPAQNLFAKQAQSVERLEYGATKLAASQPRKPWSPGP